MPYFNNKRVEHTRTSSTKTVQGGVDYSVSLGQMLSKGSVETGFRTRAPSEGLVTNVASSVADPHAYFQDLMALKERAAIKSGFDSSMFREDKGHPWDLMKYQFRGLPWNYTVTGASNSRVGTFIRPWVSTPGYDGFNFLSGFDLATQVARTDLQSYGATTYGSASPISDRFSFSAFAGELREGLPKFFSETLRSQGNKLRDVGSDYLNVQFGWIPLLNDLRGIATALIRASHGLYQPAGATHRIRSEKPTELKQSGKLLNNPVAIASGNYGDPVALKGSGTGSLTDHFIRADISWKIDAYRRRWFEGEFVYIPEAGFDATKYDDRLATLFKTDITPSDLWQLAPWSWLVDYFTDIGGALEAAEAAISSRTLSTYAYAMEEIKQVKTVTLSKVKGESGSWVYSGPDRYTCWWETTSYRRIRANPFGFTVNPTVNLNGGQIAILGALGLTKSKI